MAAPAWGTSGTLVVSTDVTLTEDHDGPVQIAADSVVLDCAGHTIEGPGDGSQTGIEMIDVSGVVVQNCTVQGFGVGVLVQGRGAIGNTVRDSESSSNVTGLLLRDTSGHVILNNTLVDNVDEGVRLDSEADSNSIVDNDVSGSSQGIVLHTADDNALTHNGIGYASGDFAIGLVDGANDNRLVDNNVWQSSIGVVVRDDSIRNLIQRTTVTEGGRGFVSARTSDNEFITNLAGGEMGNGFELEMVHDTLLRDNTSYTVDGFLLLDSWDNTLEGNIAVHSAVGFSDDSTGSGTAGTASSYTNNRCVGTEVASEPPGLCIPYLPRGYRLLEANGSIYSCGVPAEPCTRGQSGRVTHHGDPAADGVMASVTAVDMAVTPTFQGYNVLLSDGRVIAYGDAPDLGGITVPAGHERVVSIALTATGNGYWVFTNVGRVIALGDATHYGDLPGLGITPAGGIIDSAAVADGSGYYVLGADGGVFAFPTGVTPFHGSIPQVLPGVTLACSPVGMAPTRSGAGYWIVGCDGGVFAFGDVRFGGSLPGMGITNLNGPITDVMAFGAVDGPIGYVMVGSDGGVFHFGPPFFGTLGASPPDTPIVTITPYLT